MTQLFTGFLFLCFLMMATAPVMAQDASDPYGADNGPYVTAQLVSESGVLVRGEENIIGLHEEILDEWHVYWKNPGDSGLETRVEWNVPQGVEVRDFIWPAPKPLPYQGLVNYGFEEDLLIKIPVFVPSDYVGDEITLSGKATWLVCKEICLPEEQELSLTLKVVDEAPSSQTTPAIFQEFEWFFPKDYAAETQGSATFEKTEDEFRLILSDFPEIEGVQKIHFFPYEYGGLEYAAPQQWARTGDVFEVITKPQTPQQPEMVTGLLKIQTLKDFRVFAIEASPVGGDDVAQEMAAPVGVDDGTQTQSIETEPAEIATPEAAATTETLDEVAINDVSSVESTGILAFWQVLLFAVLGGMILNLMPCVFPVLFMKAMHLINHENDETEVRTSALYYLFGVLLSFVIVGGALLVLRALGQEIGWGFQLQSPIFVSLMALLFMLIGMNFLGVFDIGSGAMGWGSKLAGREGRGGAFWTGVLAVVVATPCTAPFMASALGATLVLPPALSVLVFVALGFGLALPFVLISIIPVLRRLLPSPGLWMETFKQFLAFPMFASALWLLWVLSFQGGSTLILATLAVGFMLTFILWMMNKRTSLVTLIVALAALCAAGYLFYGYVVGSEPNMPSLDQAAQTSYEQPFTQERYDALVADGNKIFVNMTAAWCITCQANDRSTLATDTVKQAFADNNVTYLKGDWTSFNKEITAFLKTHGRNGVPLYVYVDGNGETHVLPQILTPSLVLETLNK